MILRGCRSKTLKKALLTTSLMTIGRMADRPLSWSGTLQKKSCLARGADCVQSFELIDAMNKLGCNAIEGQVDNPVNRRWVRSYRCNNKKCCDGALSIQVAHTTDTKEHFCAWCGEQCVYENDVMVCDV